MQRPPPPPWLMQPRAAGRLAEHARRPVAPEDRDGVADRGGRVDVAPVAADREVHGPSESAPGGAALGAAAVGDAAGRALSLREPVRALRRARSPRCCASRPRARSGCRGSRPPPRATRARAPRAQPEAARGGSRSPAAPAGWVRLPSARAVEDRHRAREAPAGHVDVGRRRGSRPRWSARSGRGRRAAAAGPLAEAAARRRGAAAAPRFAGCARRR